MTIPIWQPLLSPLSPSKALCSHPSPRRREEVPRPFDDGGSDDDDAVPVPATKVSAPAHAPAPSPSPAKKTLRGLFDSDGDDDFLFGKPAAAPPTPPAAQRQTLPGLSAKAAQGPAPALFSLRLPGRANYSTSEGSATSYSALTVFLVKKSGKEEGMNRGAVRQEARNETKK